MTTFYLLNPFGDEDFGPSVATPAFAWSRVATTASLTKSDPCGNGESVRAYP
jgi:hypothetical protein